MKDKPEQAPKKATPPQQGEGVSAVVSPVEPPPHSLSLSWLWDKIKRHKVAEWTLAYVAFSYAFLHGAELLSDAQEWPHVIVRVLSLILVLGVPIVATLAWFHGHRAQHRISRVELFILIVLLASAGVVLWRLSGTDRDHVAAQSTPASAPALPTSSVAGTASTTFSPPSHSVAVLPFTNLSGDPKQEYFSDGVSEEMINVLAHIDALEVSARTSSFSFKGQNVDISTIARKLNVAAILEGSIRRSGNTVRITVQLINTASGFHIWSRDYDRNLRDILKLQTEVASSVAQQMKITLASDIQNKSETHDINPNAYTVYLEGRRALREANTKGEYDYAIKLFRQAVTVDPEFAEGWFYLEAANSDQVLSGMVKAEVASAEMRRAADKVATIAPGSALAHRSAAQIYWTLDRNWSAATAEYQQVYDLDPGNSDAVRQLADVTHVILGNDATALILYRRAVELDPLNAYGYLQIGQYYLDIGNLPEAESAFRQALILDPKVVGASGSLCQTLVVRGKASEAMAVMQRAPDDSDRRQCAALVYQARGNKKVADAAVADMERLNATEDAYSIAEIHAYRNETDQAFAWLDRAYRQREISLVYVKVDPLLNTLRGDPRYKAFLRKVHLPS
jgi:TolB-like protein/thioredoxin-like negative regulator of GroEL